MKYLKLFESFKEVSVDNDDLDHHKVVSTTKREKTKIKQILGTGWKMDEEEHSVRNVESKYITSKKIEGNKRYELSIEKNEDHWYIVTFVISDKTIKKRIPGGYIWSPKKDTWKHYHCDQESGLYQCLKSIKSEFRI